MTNKISMMGVLAANASVMYCYHFPPPRLFPQRLHLPHATGGVDCLSAVALSPVPHRLGPLELVPLLSFLWQRGRCRHCGAPIAWRYPLVELLTAILLSLVYLRFGWSLELVYHAGLTALYIVISFIDLDTMIIPTELVIMGMAWAGVYNLYTRQPLAVWLFGGILGYGLFYLIYVLSRGGMGGGDVRLAGLLGLVLGPKQLACALLIAFVTGAVVSLALLGCGRAQRKTAIPFGPFLAVGGYVAALWGQAIIGWYLGLFF